MNRVLLICAAGAVGTGARYFLSGLALRALGPGFAYGTLVVNVLGSLLLGALMQVALTTDLLSPTWRLMLTTGFCGGFTTYSTFNYETMSYFEERAWLLGFLNIAATLVLCLAAGLLGAAGMRWLVGRQA